MDAVWEHDPAMEEAEVTRELFDFVSKGLMVQAVAVAAKLGIADLLTEGAKTAEELARETGAHPPTLYRLLRALTGVGIVAQDDDLRFSLAPLGAALRSGPESGRERTRFFGEPFVWDAWGHLEHSVMTGTSAFRDAHGVGFFEFFAGNADAAATFHAFMTRQSELQVPLILAAYDFSEARKIVDVGGGHGSLLAAVLRANPGATGVLYDLAEVVENATHVRAPDLAARCKTVAGSFFETVPGGGDCYLLKLVIHDWDDQRAVEILRNIRAAIAADGRLLLLEAVMPAGNDYHHAKFMDLNMLVLTDGGRERTEDEFRELFRAAGFALARTVATASPLSIVEAVPA